MAESQKNELTVSESIVVGATSSVNYRQNTNKKILTFVGQYSDQKASGGFADPKEEECEYGITLARTICLHSSIAWEKKRKASGHLEFRGTEFADKDEATFKATLKEGSNDNYEVTISFTLTIGGIQQSVSAEVRNFVLSFRPP